MIGMINFILGTLGVSMNTPKQPVTDGDMTFEA